MYTVMLYTQTSVSAVRTVLRNLYLAVNTDNLKDLKAACSQKKPLPYASQPKGLGSPFCCFKTKLCIMTVYGRAQRQCTALTQQEHKTKCF